MVGEFDKWQDIPGYADRSRRSQPTSEDAQIERDPEDQQAWFRSMWEGKAAVEQPVALQDDADKVAVEDADQDEDDFGDDQDAQNDDDFGDDFDEFAEEAEDDDFGDFDDATPAAEVPPPSVPPLQDTSSQNIFAGLVSSLSTNPRYVLTPLHQTDRTPAFS
jgi:hypothetical protein